MKESSLQIRFLAIVLSAIFIMTIFVGGISIYEVDDYVQNETHNSIRVTCENEATKVNKTFEGMEKSVGIIENYVCSFFKSLSDVRNKDRQDKVIQYVEEMFGYVAKNTEGASAYYFRLSPEVSDNTTGIFFSKTSESDEFIRFEPTDLSLYDKNDNEHVGWYWQPYEAGKPMWMTPYYNQNNGIHMISYVVPLYCEGTFIGVVGMDFDYSTLIEIVHKIKIYENGFAHLEFNNEVIHGASGNEENSNPEDYLRVSEVLANGMTLVISVHYGDISQERYDIGLKLLLLLLFFSLSFSFIVIFVVKKIVKPLKKLTDASIKISNGDYNVEIDHSNVREIKLLNDSFEKMIVNLRGYANLQHQLSHRDSLTGLRNTTSYKSWMLEVNRKIKNGDNSFGIAVFDINDLKKINDTYGHTLGNELILTSSKIICDTFKRSPVFRIGGDEFSVILQNKDLENIETLFENLDDACKSKYIDKDNRKLPIRIAKGFSRFDPEKDTQFSDVFERADSEMYKNKRDMKVASI